jgi:hypothetical protein
LVKYTQENEELDQFEWTYTGGCFKGNQPVLYSPAQVSEVYDFRSLQVEIRLDHRMSDSYLEDVQEQGRNAIAGVKKGHLSEPAKEEEEESQVERIQNENADGTNSYQLDETGGAKTKI